MPPNKTVFSSSERTASYPLYSVIGLVDVRLVRIKPSYNITRLPRSIAQRLKCWKASELHSWLVVVGGPGIIVEIDESLFCRHKYNVGRLVREQWVFGGIEDYSVGDIQLPMHHRCVCHTLQLVADHGRRPRTPTTDADHAEATPAQKRFSRAAFAKTQALWKRTGLSVQAAEALWAGSYTAEPNTVELRLLCDRALGPPRAGVWGACTAQRVHRPQRLGKQRLKTGKCFSDCSDFVYSTIKII